MSGIARIHGNICIPFKQSQPIKPETTDTQTTQPNTNAQVNTNAQDTFVKSQPEEDEAVKRYKEEQARKQAEFQVLINKPQTYHIDTKA